MSGSNKKVLVGMSGGIDSTATCLMLREQGYDIVGLTMSAWVLSIMWQTCVRSSAERLCDILLMNTVQDAHRILA